MKNLVQRTGATYDATINGALTLANPLIKCKTTKCMDLDGATNYLSLANPVTGLSTCSIVLWANMDVVDGVAWSRDGAGNNYIYINALSKLIFTTDAIGALSSKNNFPNSRTYMIVLSMLAGITSMYVDGKRLVSANLGTMTAVVNALIGRYGGGGAFFNGRLDNMLFYNVALTPDQINSIYRSANPRM